MLIYPRAGAIQRKVQVQWDRILWRFTLLKFSHPFPSTSCPKKRRNSFKAVFPPATPSLQRPENGDDELLTPQSATTSIANALLNLREQRMLRWPVASLNRCQPQLLIKILYVLASHILRRRGIITSQSGSLSKAHRHI